MSLKQSFMTKSAPTGKKTGNLTICKILSTTGNTQNPTIDLLKLRITNKASLYFLFNQNSLSYINGLGRRQTDRLKPADVDYTIVFVCFCSLYHVKKQGMFSFKRPTNRKAAITVALTESLSTAPDFEPVVFLLDVHTQHSTPLLPSNKRKAASGHFLTV